MTIEDNRQYNEESECEDERDVHGTTELNYKSRIKINVLVSGLILIILMLNLPLYNFWLIPKYNSEVECILENNDNCVNITYNCIDNDYDISKINVAEILGISLLSLCIIALMTMGFLWYRKDKDKIYVGLGLCTMAFLLALNFVIYYNMTICSYNVLEYQDSGCYILTNTNIFVYMKVYNIFNVFSALFCECIILLCLILIE